MVQLGWAAIDYAQAHGWFPEHRSDCAMHPLQIMQEAPDPAGRIRIRICGCGASRLNEKLAAANEVPVEEYP